MKRLRGVDAHEEPAEWTAEQAFAGGAGKVVMRPPEQAPPFGVERPLGFLLCLVVPRMPCTHHVLCDVGGAVLA